MRALLTVAVATVAWAAGCASPPQAETRPGTLLLGTAHVTVNDTDAGVTDQVSCSVAGPATTIVIGDGQSGVTAVVSTAADLTPQSVRIRNVGGFTGDYTAGFGFPPTATRTGRSYAIEGSANGFFTSQPAIRTSGTFTIDVAC